MSRPIIVCLFVVLLLVPSLPAQNPLVVARQLTLPADALCKAAGGQPITLAELSRLITRHHGIRVQVLDEAFRKADPKADVSTYRVTLPRKPGLRLGTVLHYALKHDLLNEATYKIAGDTLVIYPGPTQVVQDEIKDGPVGRRLSATLMSSKTDATTRVDTFITQVEKATGLPILLSHRDFTRVNEFDLLSKQLRVPRQANVPAAKFLTAALKQVNATYQVKVDHILIMPSPGLKLKK